jgi:hypothetical protein
MSDALAADRRVCAEDKFGGDDQNVGMIAGKPIKMS